MSTKLFASWKLPLLLDSLSEGTFPFLIPWPKLSVLLFSFQLNLLQNYLEKIENAL